VQYHGCKQRSESTERPTHLQARLCAQVSFLFPYLKKARIVDRIAGTKASNDNKTCFDIIDLVLKTSRLMMSKQVLLSLLAFVSHRSYSIHDPPFSK
jgi:hypothetical protein